MKWWVVVVLAKCLLLISTALSLPRDLEYSGQHRREIARMTLLQEERVYYDKCCAKQLDREIKRQWVVLNDNNGRLSWETFNKP